MSSQKEKRDERTTNGYESYRYYGPYGAIMIGANGTDEALNEAKRSLDVGETADVGLLQKWNGEAWEALA